MGKSGVHFPFLVGLSTILRLSSVQFSSVTQSCPTLRPHEPQHTRPPCPSPTPRVHPNPCPLSQWCHPTISSSVIPFSSCPLCITERIVAAQELWSERSYCFFSLKGMWGFYSHWLVPYHIFPGALEQNNFPWKIQWLESVYLVHSNQTSLKGNSQFVKQLKQKWPYKW